jgi:hypothetical protein
MFILEIIIVLQIMPLLDPRLLSCSLLRYNGNCDDLIVKFWILNSKVVSFIG